MRLQSDWMLALVRRKECTFQMSALDKWCASDLFLTQVCNLGMSAFDHCACLARFRMLLSSEAFGSDGSSRDDARFPCGSCILIVLFCHAVYLICA